MKRFIAPSPRRTTTLIRWGALLAFSTVGALASCGNGGSQTGTPLAGRGGQTAGSIPSAGDAGEATSGGTAGVSVSAGEGGGGATQAGAAGEGGAGVAGAIEPEPLRDAGVPDLPDVGFEYDAGSEPPLTPDAACGLGAVQAVPAPLDAYVVLDRSGSMNLPKSMPQGGSVPGTGDCNVGDTTFSRWCHAINSLDAFFGSSVAAGTGVALQFFPAGGCTASDSPFVTACCSSGACCGGGAERVPAVSLANLPDARPDLVAALNAEIPWADRTPIEAALRGMIHFTASARRPNRQMMGLLITDGGPEGCQSNANTLAALVRTHRSQTGVPIYVVGTQGAAFSWLETIAAAGGAPAHDDYCGGGVRPCHFYNVGSASPDVFVTVLQRIRRSAISCSFEMPQGDAGLADPNRIALSFEESGGDPVRIDRVQSRAACGSGGFYYDDNRNPQHIELCTSTCDAFRARDGGRVNILLGCQGS